MTASMLSGFGALPAWNISLLFLLAKATIILIAALGITLAMQRTSATARHLVWLVSLGTLLLVPALTAWAPLRLAILPAPRAPATSDVTHSAPGSPVRVEQSAPLANDAPNASRTAPSSSAMDRLLVPVSTLSGLSLLLVAWGAVVVAILVVLAWAGLSVRRIVRNARPLDSNDWKTPLFEIADRIGLDEAPRLLQSSDAKMPFACGILTPTIVLPAESESWTLDRRRAVLLHELAHVRRHDLLGHTLGRLVCAVYWFHPLVWTAAKRLRSESERACDDLALACGTRATDYAEHLLDIVTSVRGDSTPLVALAMARRKEFEGRMLAILDPHLRRSTPSRRQSTALIATLALVSLTVGAVAPVARSANAAAVAAVPQSSTAPLPAPRALSTPVPQRRPAYPDSGIRGEMSTSMSYAKSTRTSTTKDRSLSTSQAMSESTSNVVSRANSTAEAALRVITNAGVEYGLNVSSAVLKALAQESFAKGDKGPKRDKGTDDRPILLARVLKSDTSASLRRIAAWGLQEYSSSPVAAEALAGAVRHDADAKVREMAAWALSQGEPGSGGGSDALLAALGSDANERVRTTAAWALGELGDRSAVDGLAAALSDPAAEVRQRAAWALGNVSPKQAPKALVALLGDKEPRVRTLAAWALFNIADPSTAPAIEAALKVEQNRDVQLALIRSIAALGERSVDAVRGLLESPDARVRTMAVRALAGGHAAGPWPWPWPEPRPFP